MLSSTPDTLGGFIFPLKNSQLLDIVVASYGYLAQLVRAFRSHRKGQWFESTSGYQKTQHVLVVFFCLYTHIIH